MDEVERGLFMGIKISPKLQDELDHCVPGTECYFKEDKPEYLQFLDGSLREAIASATASLMKTVHSG